MRLMVLWIGLISSSLFAGAEAELAKIRVLYDKAPEDKASWKSLDKLLSTVDQKSAPLLVCYKGAVVMMEAKYLISPLGKLNRFKRGRKLMEEAAGKAPGNLEIRFLRFSVQTNLPTFLGYNDDIEKDKQYLLNHILKENDQDLKDRVTKYLIKSGRCSAEEIKKIK